MVARNKRARYPTFSVFTEWARSCRLSVADRPRETAASAGFSPALSLASLARGTVETCMHAFAQNLTLTAHPRRSITLLSVCVCLWRRVNVFLQEGLTVPSQHATTHPCAGPGASAFFSRLLLCSIVITGIVAASPLRDTRSSAESLPHITATPTAAREKCASGAEK